jgi:hypothetical protein
MTDEELIKKYIDEALACATTKAWVVRQDLIPKVVEAFQKLCPAIKHQVTMDWDDETLLWLRFTWEPGTLHSTPQPPAPKIILKAPSTASKPQDPPRARYGGPRW